MARITINDIWFDPRAEAQLAGAHALLTADARASDYLLIQVNGPLTKDERRQLAALDVELLEYVPEDSYVCRYRPTDLKRIRALPFVTWANAYLAGFKIAPFLHSGGAVRATGLLDVRGLPGGGSRATHLVDVVLHHGADAESVRNEVARAAGIAPEALSTTGGKFRLRIFAQRLSAIAAVDAVRHIEPVFPKKLWNDVATGIMGCRVVHEQAELQGEGQVVAVCDTGFDRGDAANPHPAFSGRVLKVYALARDTGSDPDGHGTHVCGSAVGDGLSNHLGVIRGSAPRARLVVQSALGLDRELRIPEHLKDLFSPPYTEDGARVHSNSWGDSNNGYTTDAHDVDDFVWKNRDAVILFAAGNDGADLNRDGVVDSGSVGSPGTAKNCITVGASENNRPAFNFIDGEAQFSTYGEGWPRVYPAPPLADDRLADDPEGLAAFSSRGPTSDGRIKPDVVAPGTAILSTRSREPGVGNGWALSSDPLYFYDGGTSMSTPLVAGCAAVVRQYLHQKKGLANPSAALVKAMLINAADDLTGQYSPSEAAAIPNFGEGFGRVNLAAAVAPGRDGTAVQFWDEGAALDTGEQRAFDIAIDHLSGTVKVTLVWTDPPGQGLQNDLDLIVTTGKAVTRHGNMRGASQQFDRRNNVEQVVLHTVHPGKLTVTVRAHRVAIHPQSFALVVRATP